MTLRRTVVLLVLVTLAAVLVVVVRPPERPTGAQAVHGRHVFGEEGAPVEEVSATWGDARFAARRRDAGWEIDGHPASAATATAIDDLVEALVGLRALDTFRPHDEATFGLDTPRGVIALTRAGRVRRLVVGALTAAGSAFYARREGDTRVVQVGTGLQSAVERVLFARDRQRPDSG